MRCINCGLFWAAIPIATFLLISTSSLSLSDLTQGMQSANVVECVLSCVQADKSSCQTCIESILNSTSGDEIGPYHLPKEFALNVMKGAGFHSSQDELCARGTLTSDESGCLSTYGWPMSNTTQFIAHKLMTNVTGSAVVRALDNGTLFAQPYLGKRITNPYIFQRMGPAPWGPLGSTPDTHRALRKLLARQLPNLKTDAVQYMRVQGIVRDMVGQWMKDRQVVEQILIPNDIMKLDVQIIYKVLFDESYPSNGQFNLGLDKLVQYMPIIDAIGMWYSHLFPEILYNVHLPNLPGFPSIAMKDIQAYMTNLFTLVTRTISKPGYAGGIIDDCVTVASCRDAVAQQLVVLIVAAGPLSVSGTLQVCTGLLYSDDTSNPFKGRSYDPSTESLQLFWECLRYFPPVGHFTYFEERPLCAGMTRAETDDLGVAPCPVKGYNNVGEADVNVLRGGKFSWFAINSAMSDPRAWGEDAHVFVLRPLQDYKTNGVGFAEFLVDNTYRSGEANRDCPGKSLALMIGDEYFSNFNRTEWKTDDTITFDRSLQYVNGFKKLVSVRKVYKYNVVLLIVAVLTILLVIVPVMYIRYMNTSPEQTHLIRHKRLSGLVVAIRNECKQTSLDYATYMLAAVEVLFITVLICGVITLRYHPNLYIDNAIRRNLGYNNVCVVFDLPPAAGVATVAWGVVVYMLTQAYLALKRDVWNLKVGKTSQAALIFAQGIVMVSSWIFALVWVYNPNESELDMRVHYGAFIQLIASLCLYLLAQYVVFNTSKAVTYSFAESIFVGIVIVWSVTYAACAITAITVDLNAPQITPSIQRVIDYGWFALITVYIRLLPDFSNVPTSETVPTVATTHTSNRQPVPRVTSGLGFISK